MMNNKEVNKKEYLRLFLKLLIFFLTVFIYYTAVSYGQLLNERYNMASIRQQQKTISRTDLDKYNEDLKNKNIMRITAWNIQNYIEVYSDNLQEKGTYTTYKNCNTNVYSIYGISKDVCSFPLKYGTEIMSNDSDGCLLDKDTAYNLFGTEKAVHNTVMFNNKTYFVRGIFDTSHSIMVINNNAKNAQFDNFELTVNNIENGKAIVENYLLQNGIEEGYTIIEGGFYSTLINKFILFPIYIFAAVIVLRYIKMLYVHRTLSIKYFINIFLGAVVICFVFYIIDFKFYYPARLIPSKWSDYEFWREEYKNLKTAIEQLTYVKPVLKDVVMFNYIKEAFIYVIIILCVQIGFIINTAENNWILIKHFNNEENIFIFVLLLYVYTFAAKLLLYKHNILLKIPFSYNIIVIMYILFNIIYRKINFKFKKL